MIYEIDDIILQCVDEETGEVDVEKLDRLTMENDAKMENIALWIKDLKAEEAAVADEAKKLESRSKALGNKAESLKSYLAYKLGGRKFKTAKCTISYRTSAKVKVADDCDVNNFSERFKAITVEVKPNKSAIKEYLQNGGELEGCWLEKVKNIQIK